MGLKKSYVINRVGLAKILRLLTRWVGGSKIGLKHAYVIFEWSLIQLMAAHFVLPFLLTRYFNTGATLEIHDNRFHISLL